MSSKKAKSKTTVNKNDEVSKKAKKNGEEKKDPVLICVDDRTLYDQAVLH